MREITGLSPTDQKKREVSSAELLYSNGTISLSPSQEGSLLKHLKRHAGRIGGAIAVAIIPHLSPFDGSTIVQANSGQSQKSGNPLLQDTEGYNLEAAGVSKIQGRGTRDNLNVFLVGANGTTDEMLYETAPLVNSFPPLNELDMDIYKATFTENPQCNENGSCNWEIVNKQADRIYEATGIPPHEIIVVIRSNDQSGVNGRGIVASTTGRLDIYSHSSLARPEKAAQWMLEQGIPTLIAEELWGHAFAGFDHRIDGQFIVGVDGKYRFKEEYVQRLRAKFPTVPLAYWTPEFNFRDRFASQTAEQPAIPLEKMEIPIPPTDIPDGAKWFKFEVIQQDGPAITMVYGAPAILDQFRNGTYKVEAPEVGVKNQVLKPGQKVRVRAWISNAANMPEWNSEEWTSHQIQPGLRDESTVIERTYQTPFRTADKTSLMTLSTGQETNSLTPTLVWDNADKDVYDYEIQLSADPNFETDPNKAIAAVYWETRHGGETNPKNSYTVPNNFPLEPGKTYFWRLKPRNFNPDVPWSKMGNFKTSADATIRPTVQQSVVENQPLVQALIRGDDCFADFLPQVPLDESNILDPSCYRLMDLPTVILKPGDIRVVRKSQVGVLPNRSERRKAVRLAQKSA